MYKIYYLIILFLFFFTTSYSQEDTDTTNIYSDDTLHTENNIDPQKQIILDIIKTVNSKYLDLNDIMASGEIKVKTRKNDETADIDIRIKKKDDLWFHIDGPLGIDVAEAHFSRKKFLFFNSLNDEVITGTTNILNIASLTKIRCTFDDLMNAFSGTVRIPKSKKDTLWMTEEGNNYIISLRTGTITRKYWIDRTNHNVSKYAYISKTGKTLLQLEFSNYSSYGTTSYARRVEVKRPSKGDYFSLNFDSYNTGFSSLDFRVSYPSDVKKRVFR